MPTLDDVRAIALSLPETTEVVGGQRRNLMWRTRNGSFVWERGPSKADLATLATLGRTWPDGVVVGVRTDGETGKRELLAALPDAVFTIPHFDGYPAVLLRLDAVDRDLLAELVTDAWLLQAPAGVAKAWLAERSAGS